ncbi:hypothetical protein I5L38_16765 [Serratia marcescens]|uniref:MAE_28990/MAE_18760 family HEPN-like nuclease n=1 Tax=Serratia nevei TaxID=2703794 RepID=UPI0018D73ADC|nr:hypothetical protein [Serratia marcescens]
MPEIQHQVDLSEAFFSELESTASMRMVFMDIVISNSSTLFQAFSHDKALLSKLKEAMKLKTVDQNALFRGLFIQAVAIFEDFIRNMVTHVVHSHQSQRERYSELSTSLQNYFISSSGNVLKYYGSGSVNGVKYDFSHLKKSLISCLSDNNDFYLEPRVFTISMGNCTSTRVENLFSKLCLSDNIFDKIGGNQNLKNIIQELRKSNASVLIKEKLDSIIDTRNDIAHGELTRSISKDEFDDAILFLRGLIKAFADCCV